MASAPKLGPKAPPSAADVEASREFLAWAEEHRVGGGEFKSLHAMQRNLTPVNCCMFAVKVRLFQISTQF